MSQHLDMPTFVASSYASNAIDPGAWAGAAQALDRRINLNQLAAGVVPAQQMHKAPAQAKELKMAQTNRRLVQVFIADPDENLSLSDSLLYSGDQKLTDLTDQELFFEVDIKSILDKHNEKRAKTVNKTIKERTEYLEPARIRDLKMVVTTIASF